MDNIQNVLKKNNLKLKIKNLSDLQSPNLTFRGFPTLKINSIKKPNLSGKYHLNKSVKRNSISSNDKNNKIEKLNNENQILRKKIELLEEENKRLKEENKRLREEIDEENYKIKKLEEINNDVLRQFVAINANKRLRNGTDESKQLLENLQKLDPKLCFDDNENQKEEEISEEEKSEEEKSEEEKSEEESMKGNSVDHYISSKNTEAKNQNNNVDDLKTEDDTANLKRIDINEQHI
jgi:hypothetical protein